MTRAVKRLVRGLSLWMAVLLTLCVLGGCRGGVCVSELTVTDAGGGGTRVTYFYSPAVNRSYFVSGEAMVDFLQQYLSGALSSDAGIFVLAYEGHKKVEDVPSVDTLYEMSDEEREKGYDVFSLTYSFSGIQDYNRKTRLLYNLSKEAVMQKNDDTYRVGVLDDYVDTVLKTTPILDKYGEPTGSYDVTLTETGIVSYGIVAWALVALYQQRADTSLWQTEDIYYAPFSPDESHTVFSALKTQTTVTVGETVRTVTPITGPVIEGQGQVEGIVFHVSGTLKEAPPQGIRRSWVYVVVGILLVAGLNVAVFFLIKRKKTARTFSNQ